MTERLVKIFIFEKMASSLKKFFLLKKVSDQNGVKNRNYLQKYYFFQQYLTDVSKKAVRNFHFVRFRRFGEIFLPMLQNSYKHGLASNFRKILAPI